MFFILPRCSIFHGKSSRWTPGPYACQDGLLFVCRQTRCQCLTLQSGSTAVLSAFGALAALFGLLLLWFPRQWMRMGATVGSRRRRSGSTSTATLQPWEQRDAGDPRISAKREFGKLRNYFDLLRAAAGGLAIVGGYGIQSSLHSEAANTAPEKTVRDWISSGRGPTRSMPFTASSSLICWMAICASPLATAEVFA